MSNPADVGTAMVPVVSTAPSLPEASAPRARRAAVNRRWADDLALAAEVLAAASKSEYGPTLTGEGIDTAFVGNLRTRLGEAQTLLGSVGTKRADKRSATAKEGDQRATLLDLLAVVQARAKRKYKPGDPLREKYFLGEKLDASRAQLEAAAQSMLKTLATDTLPGMKATDITALQTALTAYQGSQSTQNSEHADALNAGVQLEAKLKEVNQLRHEIQYAVDAAWPAGKAANIGTRTEFRLNPRRPMR